MGIVNKFLILIRDEVNEMDIKKVAAIGFEPTTKGL